MIFSSLHLPDFSPLKPSQLLEFSEFLGKQEPPRPIIPPITNPIKPRTFEEISKDIENNQIDKITNLEWLYLVYFKSDNNLKLCQLIWNIAKQKPWLKNRLLWNLVLYYGDEGKQTKRIISESLVNSFSVDFLDQADFQDLVTLKIIESLKKAPADLAKLSLTFKITPKDLLKTYQLPHWIKKAEDALTTVAEVFVSSRDIQYETWLINCLEEMPSQQQIKATDYLLTNISAEIAGDLPNLVEWVKLNFKPQNSNSKWHQLSGKAKEALRKWIGAVNYNDFQNIVELLLEKNNELNILDWEQNQWRSRKSFWANYSDRFERIRILLPQKSINALGQYLPKNVDLLIEDGSDTEVCIFDFGDCFIVEFFRGGDSETRLFNSSQNPKIELELFGFFSSFG
ncbi:MAG: EH signature domain-containing protein [Planktothrix sp. GU0601_MAG3]|nr:MAG: EH signature domain-containing protein [Planktothrix sp. GU0601_MAG3]